VLCGYIVSLSTLPPYLLWSVYINPLFYKMEIMFKNEFFPGNPALWAIDIEALSRTYGYTASDISQPLMWLALIIVVQKVASLICFKFVRFSRI
jgi:hypothetical protein